MKENGVVYARFYHKQGIYCIIWKDVAGDFEFVRHIHTFEEGDLVMRKNWKKGIVTALSMAMVLGNCAPSMAASTGWRKAADGNWYYYKNNTIATGWVQAADSNWYFMDYHTGAMKTGWIKPKDGNWYFMDYHTGAMRTGWIKPQDGNWYYMDNTSGSMKTGWVQTADGKWYYMDATSGSMQTGKISVGGTVWNLNADGTWDGAAGVSSYKYVSSSKDDDREPSGGGSGGGGVTTPDGDTTDKVKAEQKGSDYYLSLNAGATGDITIDSKLFGGETVITGNLYISSDIAEAGEVTLDGITVEGDVVIGEEVNTGGDGVSLYSARNHKPKFTMKGCHFKNKVKANKSLEIEFGGETKIDGDLEANAEISLNIDVSVVINNIVANATIDNIVTSTDIKLSGEGTVNNVEAKGDNELKIDTNITIKNVVASTDINLSGKGKAENVKTEGDQKLNINIDITVDNVVASTDISLSGKGEIENVKTEGGQKLNIDLNINVTTVVPSGDISLTGSGEVAEVKVNKDITITIEITVKKVEVIGNITVKVELVGEVEAPEQTGDGTVESVKVYKVTFDANGGKYKNNSESASKTVEKKEGETSYLDLDKLELEAGKPIREGYTFIGWYTDKNAQTKADSNFEVIADTTLYAGWEENTPVAEEYTVTFVLNDGSWDNGTSTTVESGATIGSVLEELKKPTREGYTFTGWYADVECKTLVKEDEKITADTKLYAGWEINEYTVTIKSSVEEWKDKTINVKHGTTIGDVIKEVGTLELNGYKLEGWYTDVDCETSVVESEEITTITTLYVKWTANPEESEVIVTGISATATGITLSGTSIGVNLTIKSGNIDTDATGNKTSTYTIKKVATGASVSVNVEKENDGGIVVSGTAINLSKITPTATVENGTLISVGWNEDKEIKVGDTYDLVVKYKDKDDNEGSVTIKVKFTIGD